MKKKKLNPIEVILLNCSWKEKELNKFDKLIKKEQVKLIFK